MEEYSAAKRKLLNQHVFYSKEDEQFFKENANLLYRTTNNAIGHGKTMLKPETKNGLNGFFTTHLANAGMWRNNSLTTVEDKERYLKGSKDWVDHLS